ncbi:MAG: ABC transporter ATP-binding protein [Candidatus Hodarchaeales archaeon]|jgi:tungstate transport system ATP-binding protein
MVQPLIVLEKFYVQANNSAKEIVDSVDLNLYPGEILGVIGPSGAGKTTLLKAIALLTNRNAIRGFYKYEDTQIFPFTNEFQFKLKKIRKNLVFIHQHPILFSGTVKFNIEYGLKIRKRIGYNVDLNSLIESFQLTELLNRNVHSLSGGEKQRVCFLRAMALKPRVLILDEPTQNLDPFNVSNIEKNIQRYIEADNGTVIIATHNLFQARRIAHRTAIMINGQIIEINDTEEIFTNPKKPLATDFLTGKMIY